MDIHVDIRGSLEIHVWILGPGSLVGRRKIVQLQPLNSFVARERIRGR